MYTIHTCTYVCVHVCIGLRAYMWTYIPILCILLLCIHAHPPSSRLLHPQHHHPPLSIPPHPAVPIFHRIAAESSPLVDFIIDHVPLTNISISCLTSRRPSGHRKSGAGQPTCIFLAP